MQNISKNSYFRKFYESNNGKTKFFEYNGDPFVKDC